MKRLMPAALILAAAGFFFVRQTPAEGPATPEKGRDHWAFKAPVRPQVPAGTSPAARQWIRNPIDAFVLARLEQEGLKRSPEADRVTLLRRLYLDLIGLPPTPKEVDEFLADKDPKAYEHLVDRLLASPHYGERWGRHWLDAARYADTDGYEKDKLRWIYFYRDWVVSAFNRDLPYDHFVIEQLAGDLLPNPTQDQIVATGFLRNSMLNEEGGVDPEQFRMDAMFDRMDAVGKSVLGVTIQCCQCHNHKFDPMTQEEYYKLFSFLNNDYEGSRTVYSPEQQQKVAEITRKIREIEAGLKEMPDIEQRLAAWEAKVKNNQPEWQVLELHHVGENSERYMPRKDGSFLAAGYAPTKHTPTFTAKSNLKEIRSFRLELLTDPDLPCGGPGRSFRGLFGLTEFKVEVTDPKDPKKKVAVKFEKATADFGNAEMELEPIFDDKSKKHRVTGPVSYAIDGKDETAWGIDAGPGRRNVDRKAVFATSKNIAVPAGTDLKIMLVQNHGGWNSDDNQNMNLGRFRISVTGVAAEADPVPKRVRENVAVPAAKRSQAQRDEVFSYFRTTVEEWREQNEVIEDLYRQWPAGDSTLTLEKRDMPRETHLLNRGDFLKPGKAVHAGVPSFLHPLADANAPANRLTFAKWLVDPRSPTTARVYVNRVWQHYFGNGLVTSPEDFGTQSQKPSHPELLDWLACEFMQPEHGTPWGIKDLHRLIVNSATYRQSSAVSPELLEKDRYNKLLARQARLRVDGEIVRDVALAASGLLNPKVGGHGVFAPAPAFLFQPPASYGPFTWTDATGPDRYRRAIYTFRRRSTPYPALQNFDVPNGDFSCVRRTRSNTPLQALTTLNETVFTECARAMAQRVVREGGANDESRLKYAFRLCVAREPSADELAELTKLAQKQRERLRAKELDPGEVATGARGKDASDMDRAVYTLVSRALLNLDETITRE
jgi:hypothetical protein